LFVMLLVFCAVVGGGLIAFFFVYMGKIEVNLKKAEEELRELDRRKSAFVSHVSHEFKNPLFTAQESLRIVLNKEAGPITSRQKQMLGFTKNSVDRLIRLVTDLLDLSKIEAGKMELKREKIDVKPWLEEVITTYEPEIRKNQMSLKKEIPQDIGAIWGDSDKLTEVVINLLSNAIKYTPAEGEVGIKVSGTRQHIQLEISDTGSGIAEADRKKIFDKFERITAESQEGTGLGLPIARDITVLHKGSISVESEPGKGSVFIVTLPRDFRNR